MDDVFGGLRSAGKEGDQTHAEQEDEREATLTSNTNNQATGSKVNHKGLSWPTNGVKSKATVIRIIPADRVLPPEETLWGRKDRRKTAEQARFDRRVPTPLVETKSRPSSLAVGYHALGEYAMQTALRVTARVQAGHKLEIIAPELNEGEQVEIVVTRQGQQERHAPEAQTLMEFLDSLPPGPRSAPTWEQLDGSLREDRDSWDR